MIRREEARLRSVFQRLLLLSAAASPAACSASESTDVTDASAKPDSSQSTALDAAAPDTGAPDSREDGAALDGAATFTTDATGIDGAPPRDARDPYGFLDSACDPEYVDGEADGSGCDFFERLPCGIPPGSPTEACYLEVDQCGTLCNQSPTLARVCAISECLAGDASTIPSTTPLTLNCATGLGGCAPGVGRRPRGLAVSNPERCGDAPGAMLAEMAHLEAASVLAFRRLGAELGSMRAPRVLVEQAKRAALDEVRHARVMSRLARRRGAKPARVVLDRPCRSRSFSDFAVENAVEGCVRESFGALVAMHQAACARDRAVAREMRRIARDETRHAALAWEIAHWLAPRLDETARTRVGRGVAGALASLRCEVARTPADVASELGLPSGADAARLVDAFAALFLSSSGDGVSRSTACSARTVGRVLACTPTWFVRAHAPTERLEE